MTTARLLPDGLASRNFRTVPSLTTSTASTERISSWSTSAMQQPLTHDEKTATERSFGFRRRNFEFYDKIEFFLGRAGFVREVETTAPKLKRLTSKIFYIRQNIWWPSFIPGVYTREPAASKIRCRVSWWRIWEKTKNYENCPWCTTIR